MATKPESKLVASHDCDTMTSMPLDGGAAAVSKGCVFKTSRLVSSESCHALHVVSGVALSAAKEVIHVAVNVTRSPHWMRFVSASSVNCPFAGSATRQAMDNNHLLPRMEQLQ